MISEKVHSAFTSNEPLKTVNDFDLQKLCGTWFEIAVFDNIFESSFCNCTYLFSMNPDGKTLKLVISGNKN